jgi:YegS/Rv2252/BmrU family lipid kinase
LFANLASRRGRKWLDQVVRLAPEAGVRIAGTYFDLSAPAINDALRAASADGISVALAMGGDGTVGSVANCLLDSEWTLGVLPSGTSNDFARSILLPLQPRGALATVAAGHTAGLDVGIVNGKAFLHAAAIGLNAAFADEADRLRRFLGPASYPVAALRVFRARKTFRARIEADGQASVFEALEVIVLNSPVFGGPLEFEAALAGVQDGKAAVMVVERLDLQSLVRALPLVLRRRILRFPGLEAFSTSELRVLAEPPLRITVDGETDGWTPMMVEVQQRALRVLVSQEFEESRHEPGQ